MAAMHCGIKRNAAREDLTLIVSDFPATAAGVYTTNLVFAAPVGWDRKQTPSDTIRAVIVNSGNANACTGEQGDRDCQQMAHLAANVVGAQADQALVLSTGIIGEFMPLKKVAAGIDALSQRLASDEAALEAAARGMMTTDTVHKIASRTVSLGAKSVQITGMCKGAAMIGPNMATMLGLVLTDAKIPAQQLQRMLTEIVEDTFNCISVDGHMSTNDTVLLVANGAAENQALAGADLEKFQTALQQVCAQLARKIPEDGEGATHLITIEIHGCATRQAARAIACSVGNSPLVKTAVAGADPNWGRIVSAAGYAGVPFDPSGVDLRVNGHLLYQSGAPVKFGAAQVSASIRDSRDTLLELTFREGDSKIRFWTTDLTADYVRLNADYHT